MPEFGFMDISSVSIKNFRSYKNATKVIFSKVTAIVGPNDAGKSTILQALDIFFNKDKITKNDLNTDSYKDNKNCCVEIEVEFNNVPPRIIIDSNFKTSLKDEYLLDKQGNLHVLKRFSLKKSDVFIKAFHPTNEGANNLLQLKNTELK